MATVYKLFSIVLSDAARVAELQAQYPDGVFMSPEDAANLFSAPISESGGAQPPAPRIDIYGLPTGSILTTAIASADWPADFTVDGDGVLFPLSGNAAGTIAWNGLFRLEAPTDNTITQIMSTRLWMCGWEIPESPSEGQTSSNTTAYSRDASRALGGRGLAIRDDVLNTVFTRSSPSTSGWERFYIRLRTKPSGVASFWSCQATGGSTVIFSLGVNASGALVLHRNNVGTLLATGQTLTVGRWYRIDATMTGFGSTEAISISVNGASNMSGTFGSHGSLETSTMGVLSLGLSAANGLELDVDDWTGRTYPTSFSGVDWLHGSHIEHFVSDTFLDSATGWTGIGGLAARQVEGLSGTLGLSSNTAGAEISALTQFKKRQLGIGALQVAVHNASAATSTNPQLGWQFATNDGTSISTIGSFDMGNITLAGTSWGTRLYTGPGTVNPLDIGGLFIKYILGTSPSGTQTIDALQVTVEQIGDFGPEDDDSVSYPSNLGTHNTPYPDSQYGNANGVPPPAPFSVLGGTYLGTGTFQTILNSQPIHWFFGRRVGGANTGYWWWSSMVGAHQWLTSTAECNHLIKMMMDKDRPLGDPNATQVTGVVNGDSIRSNTNGGTYQFIAVSDPGQRFMINGAFAHNSGLSSATNALPAADFLPLATFLLPETADGAGTTRAYYKGPGHATDTASKLDAASSSSIASLSTGAITSQTALHTTDPQTAFSAWRKSDGVYDGAVEITSYTGNGGGARTISLDLNGRAPIFAIVVPHDGGAWFKDPSHASTASQQFDGTTDTAHITGGGIDSLTVASALNTNTVIYDVFVLAATTTPFTNGGPTFVPPTTQAPPGPFLPLDTHGWWFSDEGFEGAAHITTENGRPRPPRDWQKLSAFASGNRTHLGGSPAASAIFNNHIVYPGNEYTKGTTAPTLRIFDGLADRELVKLPLTSAGAVPVAFMAALRVGDIIYLTSFDGGSSASDYAGRVFTYDPISNQLTQLSTGFSSGEVPYALAWHMGRLWLGTSQGDPSAPGKVYFIRPGIDTSWTTDHDLTSDSMGGVCSLRSFQGRLYVGCDANSGTFAKVLVRDSDGTYSTSLTATGGTAQANNGFLSMIEFQGNLYAGYWNPDTPAVSKIYKFDGSSWTTAYTGSGTTLRPFILMFEAIKKLYIAGGGADKQACLVETEDGASYINLTPFLSGPITESVIPTYGVI